MNAANRKELDVYVLVVIYEPDYMPPDIHGWFATVEEAQAYAEEFRRNSPDLKELVEATGENNERWTELGWYFAIVRPVRMDFAAAARVDKEEVG